MTQDGTGLARRLFLGAGMGVVGLGAAACRTEGPERSTEAGEGLLPDHQPFEGTEPDLPGTEDVPPGYFHYPQDPPSILTDPGFDMEPVTALLQAAVLPAPRERNPWIQQVEARIGGELHITGIPSADYTDRLNVAIAGERLPDLVQFEGGTPDLPEVLENYCVDLGEYLSGDRVQDYPALAALPDSAWTAGMVNGRLYGVAQPRSKSGLTWTLRTDLVEEMGLSFDDVTDGPSLLEFFREVTSPSEGRWAFGQDPYGRLVGGIHEMMGGVNNWGVVDGEFIRSIETPEWEESLEISRQIWDEGLIHPDSFSAPSVDWWAGGTVLFYRNAFEGWTRDKLDYPDNAVSAVATPNWDGGGAAPKHLGPGHYYAFVAMSQPTEESRVEELLWTLNVLAVPFGSSEYLDVNFGVEGDHYSLEGSDPIPTSSAAGYKSASLLYAGGTEFTILYIPGEEDLVRSQHEFLSEVIPTGVEDPSVGLHSATASARGQAEDQQLTDLQSEIIQGRQPVSAFADALRAWRNSVGDEIRAELAEAAQEAE